LLNEIWQLNPKVSIIWQHGSRATGRVMEITGKGLGTSALLFWICLF